MSTEPVPSTSGTGHRPIDYPDRTACRGCDMTITHVDQLREECPARAARYPPVTIQNRLFNILGVDPIELDDLDELTYSWDHGYERLTAKRDGGGTLDYRGVYHPGDGSCVGGGICTYCGRTLWDA